MPLALGHSCNSLALQACPHLPEFKMSHASPNATPKAVRPNEQLEPNTATRVSESLARCILFGDLALLRDETTGEEFKVPEASFRANAINNCIVQYQPLVDYVGLKPDRIVEQDDDEGDDPGNISLDVFWDRPAAHVLSVVGWPQERLKAFVSRTNENTDLEGVTLLAGSNNTHLYFVDADDPKSAERVRRYLQDDLIKDRLDVKLLKFWVEVTPQPERRPKGIKAEFVQVRIIGEDAVPGSYKAAEAALKKAAKEAGGRQGGGPLCRPGPVQLPPDLPVFDNEWYAVDKEGTGCCEQAVSFSPKLRYALVTPVHLLPDPAVDAVLPKILAQGETLFLGNEKVGLLDEVEELACFKPGGDGDGECVALVVTFSGGEVSRWELGLVPRSRVRFLTFQTAEQQLLDARSPWAAHVGHALEHLGPVGTVPCDEHEDTYNLTFSDGVPIVTPVPPTPLVQRFLQRLRLRAEQSASAELRSAQQPAMVRVVRPPEQCYLDSFLRPPWDEPIRMVLRDRYPVGGSFTVEHLQELRRRLREAESRDTDDDDKGDGLGTPQTRSPSTSSGAYPGHSPSGTPGPSASRSTCQPQAKPQNSSIKAMHELWLQPLLQLCETELQYMDPGKPAEDFLRGLQDATPLDKACRSAPALLNQCAMLQVVPNARGTAVAARAQQLLTAATPPAQDPREVTRNLTRSIHRGRSKCRGLKRLQFFRGLLSKPLVTEMYVVGLSASRIKLKCVHTGVALSCDVLLPYLRDGAYWWQALGDSEAQASGVRLHFLNLEAPLHLEMWDLLPVSLVGVVENGELGIRLQAVCTDRARRDSVAGWLPISSSRTVSTWGDYSHYRMPVPRRQYDTVHQLVASQYLAFLHHALTNTLASTGTALTQGHTQAGSFVEEDGWACYKGLCQPPLVLHVQQMGSDGSITFDIARQRSSDTRDRHPCEARFSGGCSFGDKCIYNRFPRKTCLETLKGLPCKCRSTCIKLTEDEKQKYYREHWEDYVLLGDHFVAVLWAMRDSSPVIRYLVLRKEARTATQLHAKPIALVEKEMPHQRDAQRFLCPTRGRSAPPALALLFAPSPAYMHVLNKLRPGAPPLSFPGLSALLGNPVETPLRNLLPLAPSPKAAIRQLLDTATATRLERAQPEMFSLFPEQADFIRAVTGPHAPGRVVTLLGPAGTGKTTTLKYLSWMHKHITPAGLILYLCPSNLTVDAMHDRIRSAFPELQPRRVLAVSEQHKRDTKAPMSDTCFRIPKDYQGKFVCMTVDTFVLQFVGKSKSRWPKHMKISLLVVDEMQGVSGSTLLTALDEAYQRQLEVWCRHPRKDGVTWTSRCWSHTIRIPGSMGEIYVFRPIVQWSHVF